MHSFENLSVMANYVLNESLFLFLISILSIVYCILNSVVVNDDNTPVTTTFNQTNVQLKTFDFSSNSLRCVLILVCIKADKENCHLM